MAITNKLNKVLKNNGMKRINLPPPSADGPDVTFNEDAANPRYAAINRYFPTI
jgi:hypothetical protein